MLTQSHKLISWQELIILLFIKYRSINNLVNPHFVFLLIQVTHLVYILDFQGNENKKNEIKWVYALKMHEIQGWLHKQTRHKKGAHVKLVKQTRHREGS
jgi:hypothetical protein